MGGSTKLMSSGAGGVILTTPGSIAADVTVNLPTQNSTLAINGPAFSAYNSVSTSLTSSAFTKVQFQTEEFDTANCFDSTTNYRFTPNVAGYYQINAAVGTSQTSGGMLAEIFKNGSSYKRGSATPTASGIGTFAVVGAVIYFNGSTDYVEIYSYQNQVTSVNTLTGTIYTWVNGCLVRAA